MKFGITLGAMADPIGEQLSAQGLEFEPKDAKLWDRMSKAITLNPWVWAVTFERVEEASA